MLRPEQNTFATQTGPGTPMGEMFRRYWIPAMHAEELPENECPPVRVKLLSERLLAWRDTQGNYALTDEFCAHRGVSLWFGRNEHNGLRCPYHGWKYDHTGQCIEVPSEPSESGYCQKIKLKSYPLIERGGILWAYMGPPELQPPFPEFEWATLPAAHCYNTKRLQECNYLQAMEGGIDSSHVSFLHSGDMHRDPLHRNTKGAHYQADQKPKFEVVQSAGGLFIAARRNAEAGHYYWRITQWIMPWYTMVPPYGHNALNAHAWVPIDDENCFTWTFTYHPTRPLSDMELDVMRKGGGIHVPIIPDGTFRPIINKDNDYLMDRAAQKRGETYCGVRGIAMQDASVQESMGPIQDRSKENLVSTDNAIIMARHRLLKAAREQQKGAEPPGLAAEAQRVRSATFVLPVDVPFADAKRDDLTVREGVPHTSI
jgi:phthalate 4,5-dioxygenase oxygenase subunit